MKDELQEDSHMLQMSDTGIMSVYCFEEASLKSNFLLVI